MQMRERIFAAATCLAFAGYVGVAAAAQHEPEAKDKQAQQQSANGMSEAVGAPAGGFQWPAVGAGELEVTKGKIDKWDEGKVETGGILGLGGKDLSINKDTMIVSEDGKKLSRKDLKVGREIATIYKESDKAGTNTALVVIVGEEQKR